MATASLAVPFLAWLASSRVDDRHLDAASPPPLALEVHPGFVAILLVLFCPGVLRWRVYGRWIRDAPVVVANGLTRLLTLSLLGLTLTYCG